MNRASPRAFTAGFLPPRSVSDNGGREGAGCLGEKKSEYFVFLPVHAVCQLLGGRDADHRYSSPLAATVAMATAGVRQQL